MKQFLLFFYTSSLILIFITYYITFFSKIKFFSHLLYFFSFFFNFFVKIENLSKTINTNKVDEKGETTYNTIYFTKNTVKSDEYAEIEFSIFVKGNMNKNYKDSVNYKNSIEEITYTGNVPSEYRNSKNGSIIGKQNIMEKKKEELNNRVKSKVKQIHDSSLEI